MAAPVNTLLVEGTFEDQVTELAEYIDSLRPSEPPISGEIAPMVEKGDKEDAMEKLVDASSVLSNAPEKEFIPAYNLLVHLIRTSPLLPQFIDTVTTNLQQPVKSSPNHGPSLVLSILTTIFNILPPESSLRYDVFRTILKVVQQHGVWETLAPQLKNLDKWVLEWDSGVEDVRGLLVEIADVAEKAGDPQFYAFLLAALQKIPADEADEDEAHDLAVRIVKAAINMPKQYEFGDLPTLEPVKLLAQSDPELYGLLEVFIGGDVDDYEEFKEEHDGFLENNAIDDASAFRKIRLLTLSTLACNTPNRQLPYAQIAASLHIPATEVEMWVIDVIRAGLVEGKLSQLGQTFQVHRATYRTFGKKEWAEIGTRLETWKGTLKNILEVVRTSRVQVERDAEREAREAEKASRNQGNERNQGNDRNQGIDRNQGNERNKDAGLEA